MIRLAVRVARADAETVLAELLELAPAGVEEVDLGEDALEYAVYGAPGELPSLPDVDAAVGRARVEVSTSEIPDDWHERWREFHRPVRVSASRASRPSALAVPDLVVRPPWEPPDLFGEPAVLDVVIDPDRRSARGHTPAPS